MCWCNDLFQIQSVHLQRITGPDGHWMNNATPAEGQSAISFSQKGYKTEKKKKIKNFLLHIEEERDNRFEPALLRRRVGESVSWTWEFERTQFVFFGVKSASCISFTEETRWASEGEVQPWLTLLLTSLMSHTPWNLTRLASTRRRRETHTQKCDTGSWIFTTNGRGFASPTRLLPASPHS